MIETKKLLNKIQCFIIENKKRKFNLRILNNISKLIRIFLTLCKYYFPSFNTHSFTSTQHNHFVSFFFFIPFFSSTFSFPAHFFVFIIHRSSRSVSRLLPRHTVCLFRSLTYKRYSAQTLRDCDGSCL